MTEIPINLPVSLLLVSILNALGSALKAIPGVANHYIPFLLAFFGGIGYPAVLGWTGLHVVIGVGISQGAVGLHQSFRQGASALKGKDSAGPLALVLVCLLPFGFVVGCATSSGETAFTPQRIERGVDSAVGLYATLRLDRFPESRSKFEAAQKALNVLVSNQKWDLSALAEALASTGLARAKSEEVILVIGQGVALIDNATNNSVDLNEVEYARAIILGAHTALTRVLTR